MDHKLEQLQAHDGSWAAFEDDWRTQCLAFEEDYDQFATGSLPVLRAASAEIRSDCGVFAMRNEAGGFAAIAQVNTALLPGYTGKVLRVRHLLMSPAMDFGDNAIDEYGKVLSKMFIRTVFLAYGAMPSPHVKFHLRSPADRQFFSDVVDALKEFEIFASVAMRGAWLYLGLKVPDWISVGETT